MNPKVNPNVNQVARWRLVAAGAVLAALAGFTAMFAPIYIHNLQLQNYVAKITLSAETQKQSDDTLLAGVLQKAAALDLPVKADNVHIIRSPEGLRIDVRYFVRVTAPGYTVDLHFYPGAGSR